MKKLFKYLLTLGVAALSFAACEDEQLEPVNFTISGDSSFNESLEATVKVTGDREAPADIIVGIVLDETTTFPADVLSFPATVKIAAGSKEATVTVKIAALQALEGGKEYKAVIAAKVNDVLLTQKVTITFAKPEDPVTFRFTADGAFFNNIAMLKVEASKPVKEETLVSITLDAKSTIPAEALTIPELKIAKGEQHGEIAVTLDPEVLEPGKEYTAIFNATIGNEAIGTGTVGFNKPDLNGKWSVIGLGGKWNDGDDIAMTEGADGWYTAEGVTVANNDEFKFRRDAKWDLAYGLAEKGQPELDKEFAVVTTAGCPNIGIAAEGIYSLSVNPNKAVAKIVKTGDIAKEMTLAQLKALIPNADDQKEVTAIFDFIVTSGSGNYIYAEDGTAGVLLYKISVAANLIGKKVSGPMKVTVKNYKGQKEVTKVEFNETDIKIADATLPETPLTIGALLADFDKYEAMRIKLTEVTNAADLKKGDNDISQRDDVIDLYINQELTKSVPQGSTFDVVATAVYYNTTKEVKIWDESAITNVVAPVKKMAMSDIQALCTSATKVNFVGTFEGLYINYILGTQHIYLEDKSGAIRYYAEYGKTVKVGGEDYTLKVGDKISGVLSGMCNLDSGRPTICYLDFSKATVVAAPADEQPKPVTGTLGSFTDVAGLMYRRVILENVVLDADLVTDKSSQIITISDATGTFQLHVRFKPSKKYVKGSTLSGTGTFDVASGKLEIRIFAEKEVTITAPEPKPALERLWGVYSSTSALWTTNVKAISITHPDGYGMARSIAMDDEYIYFPKSSGYAAVGAVAITNPQTQVAGNVTGIAGGSIFVTSFARMIKNTDASVNGGKDVLLVCNLTETKTDEAKLVVYAYTSGITAAPVVLCAFCWDNKNNVNDWRRYGDRFFVTGTWQEGKLYFPSFNEGKTVILSVANGARTEVTQITATTNSPDGIKDATVYPGDNKLFLTNASIANLVGADGSLANNWYNCVLVGSCEKAKGTWGYNFFEFNGKKYIAYARIDGNKAWIEVIEDKGDLLTSLEAQAGLIKSPIHSATDLDAEFATGGVADCCVRVIDGTVYIAALTRDGGAVVDKMVLK